MSLNIKTAVKKVVRDTAPHLSVIISRYITRRAGFHQFPNSYQILPVSVLDLYPYGFYI